VVPGWQAGRLRYTKFKVHLWRSCDALALTSASPKPMGCGWSYSACRIGQRVPIWQPLTGVLNSRVHRFFAAFLLAAQLGAGLLAAGASWRLHSKALSR
jgi:hypothetical protein